MKSIRFWMLATLLAGAVNANAQFVNSSSNRTVGNNGGGSSLVRDTENYSRFEFGFSKQNLTDQHGDNFFEYCDDVDALKGFRIGWINGACVGNGYPLFIEYGANLAFHTAKEEDDDSKTRFNMLALNIPFNLTYKLTFNNGMYLSPYAGIHFKVNMIGKEKTTYDSDYDDDETTNYFDSDDMGGSKYTANRFQMGWQIGANLGYKKLNFNIGYDADFLPFYKEHKNEINTKGFIVTMGVNF